MSRDKQRDEETEIKKDEKSDRLKRREHRQQIRDGQIASTNACVNLTNEMQVCPIPQKKTAYESRKTQKSGKDDDEIKKMAWITTMIKSASANSLMILEWRRKRNPSLEKRNHDNPIYISYQKSLMGAPFSKLDTVILRVTPWWVYV